MVSTNVTQRHSNLFMMHEVNPEQSTVLRLPEKAERIFNSHRCVQSFAF